MVRTLLGIVAGLAAMFVVITAVQWLGAQLYPPPPGLDLRDQHGMAALIAQLPLAALAFVVLGWLLGALAGGWVAARIGRDHPRAAAAAVGLAVVAGVVLMVASIPHPLWMGALGLLLPVPAALLGARLARGGPRPKL
jgi:MFS family permease